MSKDYRSRSRSRNKSDPLPSRVYSVPLPKDAASMLLDDNYYLLNKVRNRFHRVDVSFNTRVEEPRMGFSGSSEEEVKNAMFYPYYLIERNETQKNILMKNIFALRNPPLLQKIR